MNWEYFKNPSCGEVYRCSVGSYSYLTYPLTGGKWHISKTRMRGVCTTETFTVDSKAAAFRKAEELFYGQSHD